jgi:hypothetical protein
VIRTYKQERWVQNSDRIGKEDSLSAWYSVEELEQFLETAKQHGADGIKIYFAAYPENYTEVPEYAGRQTVVLVGTRQKKSTKGIMDKDIYISTEKGKQILAYNMSKICPPLCGTGENEDLGGLGITIVDRKDKGLTIV